MNLGQAKKHALALIAEYSVDGLEISEGENADYLNRMPLFAHEAQMDISSRSGVTDVISFELQKADEKKYNYVALPPDYREMKYVFFDEELFTGNYTILKNQIRFNSGYSGTIDLYYWKYPKELTKETEDSYEFEIDKEYHHLIPYYVGGKCMTDENPDIAERLLSDYYRRLEDVREAHEDGQERIDNVFTIF
ncbi:hypothetical protein CPT_Pascal12 [Bacillus phage Pascal]|uniref:Uncharacterized protein n=1 Tax=Bacillus phage Pascal TaxID=1540092 RepID=A0A0A0RNP7_9CAUD|nr:hypothetical protein CPT_Pascal12 [Bacillus phage Pascal]AIW03647.1 hypothetical protein CPT_Pascal12 [Bacillus phage Pascal]